VWRNPYSHEGFEKGYGATIYPPPAAGKGSASLQQLDGGGRERPARADVDRVYGTGACCRRAGD
jgi:hypothetical protein